MNDGTCPVHPGTTMLVDRTTDYPRLYCPKCEAKLHGRGITG